MGFRTPHVIHRDRRKNEHPDKRIFVRSFILKEPFRDLKKNDFSKIFFLF